VISRGESDATATVSAEVPAMSLRKVPVELVLPDGDLGKEQKFEIACTELGVTDKATIALSVKKINETHRETFISQIDGSLQYYGVNPAQKPSNSNALVLSLHGAGVEAIGQASAYSNKDWCTLVAATNRRPYGFDWEDVGRLDALEVLDIAKKEFPHDPASVHLTGHSMGGHGTWAIGTLYQNLFASIAPSAAWISFWSYAGGYQPSNPTPIESEFLRAMSPSDTLARVNNTLEEKVYVLHGDQDDNVPVSEARHMKQVLTSIHADFEYHEQPGAGHWWGSPCVDWPGIFDQIKNSRLMPRTSIDFTTPSPAVSAQDQWVTVLQQIRSMSISRVKISDTTGTTENVQALRLDRRFDSLTLDGQQLGKVRKGTEFVRVDGKWMVARLHDGAKSPKLSGPFKNVYQNKFVFVVGTHGTPEENAWASDKARYDAETFEYRGNGSVDIVTDKQYNSGWQRNVILYGNSDTNSAWKPLLARSPIQVSRGKITIGTDTMTGDDLAGLFVYPHKARGRWILVGAISGTGVEGCRTTDRLALFTSGVAYPDWTVMTSQVLTQGDKGIKACGFFDNDWNLSEADSAANK
jgi:poly(3-hydroxybutyrate) depolymerase